MSRNGRSDWQGVVERFRGSGLTQKRFCEKEGISPSTFSYRMRKAAANTESGSARFVELGFLSTEPQVDIEKSADLVVELPMGVVLRFRGVSR